LFDFPRSVSARRAEASIDGRDALMWFHDRWYATELMQMTKYE
jgi:hypothetical protein